MRIWLCASVLIGCMCIVGCDKAPVDYSQHYKHGDDVFYKGTFVVKETVASILQFKGVTNTGGRLYELLGTDVIFQTEVVGAELNHEKLLILRRQGYRVIVR